MINGVISEHDINFITRTEFALLSEKTDSLAIRNAKDGQRLDDAIDKMSRMSDNIEVISGNIQKLNECLIKLIERKGFVEKVWIISLRAGWGIVIFFAGIFGLRAVGLIKTFATWLLS